MNKTEVLNLLSRLDACEGATEWVKTSEETTSSGLWNTCQRADWMLWLLAKNPALDRKAVVRCASEIARTALQYTKDPRVGACLDVVDRWVLGEATLEEVRKARDAADAAAAARAKARAQNADIVRKHFTVEQALGN